MKQRNIFGLVLIDTGNLVHTSIVEPLVIRGLNHSENLGIGFLQENNLKLICTGER